MHSLLIKGRQRIYLLCLENSYLSSIPLMFVCLLHYNLHTYLMLFRYGRRPTILLMIYLEVPLAIATALPNSYTTYIVLRIVGGLFFPALYQQPFILALELMPPSRRPNVGMYKLQKTN